MTSTALREKKFATGWLTSALVCLSLLSGCRSASLPALRIATGDSGQGLEPHRQILAAFRPGLETRLEAVAGGDYYTRLLTELASGDPPDLLQVGDDAVGLFVQRGALLPLDERWQQLDWLPGVLEPGRWQGRQYLLPKDYSPLAVYCNLRLFREAGVQLPGPDWNWQQFMDTAQRLRRSDRWGVVWPGPHSGALEYLVALQGGRLVASNGSYLGALDGPAMVQALQQLHSLYYAPGVAPLPLDLGSFDGGNLDFEQGHAAMKVGGRWPQASLLKQKDLELALLPMPRGPYPANLLFWAGMGIAADSNNQQMALELLSAYCGPQGSKVWQRWALPALQSVTTECGLQKDPLERVWLGELEQLTPRAYSYDPYWKQIGQTALEQLSEAAVVLPDADLAALAHEHALRAESQRLRRKAEAYR